MYSMSTFDNSSLIFQQNIQKQYKEAELARKELAVQAIDTYKGFGLPYLKELIDTVGTKQIVKDAFKSFAVNFPLLKHFINSLSMVYKSQPMRTFYKDGKQLVKSIDNETMDKEKYIVDEVNYNILSDFYDNELNMGIKQAERYTNLLQTTVSKLVRVKNPDGTFGKIKLVFIPNDVVEVETNENDPTQANLISFLQQVKGQRTGNAEYIHEVWTPELHGTLTNNKTMIEEENTAAKGKYIGSGFAPFIVFRDTLSIDTFWNLSDQDTINLINQINLALTELRYLQRFTSFGQKYVIDANLPEGLTLDPLATWSFTSKQDNSMAGSDSVKPEVGEIKNDGRILELTESIAHLIKMLYVMKDLEPDAFVSSKDKASAESKKLDMANKLAVITDKQDMWRLNEEHLFETLLAVHNRDNVKQLPEGLSIKIDYEDAEQSLDDLNALTENWLAKINNSIATPIDWIMDINKDLSQSEAVMQYDKNKKFNIGSLSKYGTQNEIDTDGEDKTNGAE